MPLHEFRERPGHVSAEFPRVVRRDLDVRGVGVGQFDRPGQDGIREFARPHFGAGGQNAVLVLEVVLLGVPVFAERQIVLDFVGDLARFLVLLEDFEVLVTGGGHFLVRPHR